MDPHQFCYWGKRMVDYICEYQRSLPNRRVIPTVEPGYLRPMLPEEAPEDGETWNKIFDDLDQLIVPGLTHWHHPSFHAYFPAANSVPSIMADMLSAAFGCIGFSWAASPAITELEIVMMDWLAKLLHLPEEFLHTSGKGGGVIQSSASDCMLVSMLAARHRAIQRHKHIFEEQGDPNPETAVLSRLVAYASTLAHSCVEKASMICFVKFRQLDVDEDFGFRADVLQAAMEEDMKRGLIPFFVCATLGSTACCSFDDLVTIGPVCDNFNVWLHVDAAYAGNAFICPEFRHYLKGVEHVWSLNINPNKWMLVGFDCSLMWVRDHRILTSSMVVDPVYLRHKNSSKAVDFRNWGIPLSRRFRALKLWFVLRIYGANGIREYIRRHVRLARIFAEFVRSDDRFEIVGNPVMGLVCFRLKGSNTLNQYLTRALNESLEMHVVPSVVKDVYFIRFAVCSESASEADIRRAWDTILLISSEILAAQDALDQWRRCVLGKSGIDPIKASLDDLNISTTSDEDDAAICDAQQYWDKALVNGHADEQLSKLMRQRLQELRELGATDAYNLLLSYLQNSGWCLEDLEVEAVLKADAKSSDADDSGKFSILNGETPPKQFANSMEQCNAKNTDMENVIKNPSKQTGEDLQRKEFDTETPPSPQAPVPPLSPPNFTQNCHSITDDLLDDGGKTSSPIVQKIRVDQCHAAATIAETGPRAKLTLKELVRNAEIVKQSEGVKQPLSREIQDKDTLNNSAPEFKSMPRSTGSILSKSFDYIPSHTFMRRMKTLPTQTETSREAYRCERDLRVGMTRDLTTLARIHRNVLRRMISEPASGTVRVSGGGDMLPELSCYRDGTQKQLNSFLEEILTPTQLALNNSTGRTYPLSQPVSACNSILSAPTDDSSRQTVPKDCAIKCVAETQHSAVANIVSHASKKSALIGAGKQQK